jgi:hypothetical protein
MIFLSVVPSFKLEFDDGLSADWDCSPMIQYEKWPTLKKLQSLDNGYWDRKLLSSNINKKGYIVYGINTTTWGSAVLGPGFKVDDMVTVRLQFNSI